jgi:hypothetical protein
VSPQHLGETYRHAIDARRVTEYEVICVNAVSIAIW